MEGPNILQLIEELRENIAQVFKESETAEEKNSSAERPNVYNLEEGTNTLKQPILKDPNPNAQDHFENIPDQCDISRDVGKMRLQLRHTYELLISARDALEGINFGNLKNRIKNIRLEPADNDIDEFMKRRPFNENIDELTDLMKQKFKDHPKEFEDIPELNSFFRTCSQLQLGLEKLTKQTEEYEDLEKRVIQATEDQETRIDEIKNQLQQIEKHK